MNFKVFAQVFGAVFLAEMADKTQIATMAFASRASHPKLTVFLASASALVLASGIAVLLGSFVAKHVGEKTISWAAGLVFIAIGVWTVVQAIRG